MVEFVDHNGSSVVIVGAERARYGGWPGEIMTSKNDATWTVSGEIEVTAEIAGELDATVDARTAVSMNASRPAVNLPGRYADLGLIGAGSFGEVRRVHDMVLDRVVAMKLLHAEYAAVPQVRRRFLGSE